MRSCVCVCVCLFVFMFLLVCVFLFVQVTDIAFNSRCTQCAAGSLDRNALIFNPKTGAITRIINSDPSEFGVREGVCASALAKGLENSDERVRDGARRLVPLVSEPGDDGAIVQVCAKLGSPHDFVRRASLGLLGEMMRDVGGGGHEGVMLLCRLMMKNDAGVQVCYCARVHARVWPKAFLFFMNVVLRWAGVMVPLRLCMHTQ